MLKLLPLAIAAGIANQPVSPVIESGGAICTTHSTYSSQCSLAWDLSSSPRTYYVVERLDPRSGDWAPLHERRYLSPYRQGVQVRVGQLYRVRGCDDRALTANCITTLAAWAPILRPATVLPATVTITRPDGSEQVASIGKDGAENEQNVQYNVYLLADLLGRAADTSLPPMTRPPEPGTHEDLAHEIHHNVYIAYEAIRDQREN